MSEQYAEALNREARDARADKIESAARDALAALENERADVTYATLVKLVALKEALA